MNTPTHVMLNALVLGRGRWSAHWLAISGGALAPDLSMVFLYVYERIVLGTPERVIWRTRYYDPDWQLVVDLFNSFPLIGLAGLIAWRLRSTAWVAFFASMALHCAIDLLVHREDAHAHFFPLSSWRFISPVSYWEPSHYGWLVGPLEVLLIVGGAVVLFRSEILAWRRIARGVLVASLVFVLFAMTMWAF